MLIGTFLAAKRGSGNGSAGASPSRMLNCLLIQLPSQTMGWPGELRIWIAIRARTPWGVLRFGTQLAVERFVEIRRLSIRNQSGGRLVATSPILHLLEHRHESFGKKSIR